MASPSAIFDEIVTTTLREHPTSLADNVSNENALWAWLNSRGRIKRIQGGYEIVEPLDYGGNTNFTRYAGYEPFGVGAQEVLTAAKWDWKQAAISITASGKELRMNSARAQLIDLAEARINSARRDMANSLSVDTYSLGTADGGKQIGGMQQLITSNGEGTVGGIDSATWPFWANKFKDGAGATAATITLRMNELWLDTKRGTDKTDLITSSNELYALYWNSLQDKQRYASEDKAVAGFQSLMYVTASIVNDGGSGIPANTMYFNNSKYMKLVVHRDADMAVLEDRKPVNQDAVVIPIIWQGNLALSNRARQGVLFD
jgi:hypothetical protein